MKLNNLSYFVFYFLLINSFETLIYAQAEWSVAPSQFEHSMTITCVVIDESSNYYQEEITIGVFDGDQCVGTATTDTYFPPIDGNLAFLVTYGNQFSANYSIKVIVDDIITDAGNLNFEANGVLGTLEGPYIISPIYVINGCTEEIAFNYNPDAIIDDGSCIESILGCIDSNYLEFDINANVDDASCQTEIVYGCMNNNFIEYNIDANSGDQNTFCLTEIVYGCLDDHFVEFNLIANFDDGSCELTWQEAYLNVIEECLEPIQSEINVNLPQGWSMVGFYYNESIDIIEATNCIVEDIIIIKDYFGEVYYPLWGYNGIGNLNPGFGYKIKLNQSITEFNFCN